MLFDGVCVLCEGSANFIAKRDPKKRFRFAAIQSERGQALLKEHSLPTDSVDTIVLLVDNRHYLRSSAALQIAKALPWLWKCFYIFVVVPRPLRDLVYRGIAKIRYRIFGKKDECAVPAEEYSDRYLL